VSEKSKEQFSKLVSEAKDELDSSVDFGNLTPYTGPDRFDIDRNAPEYTGKTVKEIILGYDIPQKTMPNLHTTNALRRLLHSVSKEISSHDYLELDEYIQACHQVTVNRLLGKLSH